MKLLSFNHSSDNEIIGRILGSNDTSTFNVLYEKYYKKVYARCKNLVQYAEDAEELTHDVFLKAFNGLYTLRNSTSFSSWLYAIAYRVSIDHLRKSKKIISEVITPQIADQVDEVDDQELLSIKEDRLSVVLELLNPLDKAILLMKYQDNMKLKDIQSTLKISESSAKMRLKRAKAKAIKVYTQLYFSK